LCGRNARQTAHWTAEACVSNIAEIKPF